MESIPSTTESSKIEVMILAGVRPTRCSVEENHMTGAVFQKVGRRRIGSTIVLELTVGIGTETSGIGFQPVFQQPQAGSLCHVSVPLFICIRSHGGASLRGWHAVGEASKP